MRAAEYDRLSDAAHQAVVLAERNARLAGHDVVGTEHLLVALADQDDEVRDRLAAVDVTLAALRARVDEWSHQGAPVQRAVFSPSLRRTVHLAGRLATQDRSNMVTGRHLLQALLEVEDDFVLRVLIGLGVDPGALRRRFARAVTPPAAAIPAPNGAEMVAAPRRRGILHTLGLR